MFIVLCDCPSNHPNYPIAFGPLAWSEAKALQEDHYQRSGLHHQILKLDYPYSLFERRAGYLP